MSEKDTYQHLKNGIKQPGDRIQRIENIYENGTPDVNLCLWGVESWVEIKSPIEPKRKTSKLLRSNHMLTQDQKNWFLAQSNAQGLGFIFIETDKRRILYPGKLADLLNDLTVDEILDKSLWSANIPTTKDEWIGLRLKLRHE